MSCKTCGQCCINNGLIPPLCWPDEGPEWLRDFYDRLPALLVDTAEEYPCVFLTDYRRCAIYRDRPAVCRDFSCEPQEGELMTIDDLRQLCEADEFVRLRLPAPNGEGRTRRLCGRYGPRGEIISGRPHSHQMVKFLSADVLRYLARKQARESGPDKPDTGEGTDILGSP